MKDFLIFIPLTIVYLAIKSTLFTSVPMPDLPLIIVFYAAYRKANIEGALLGFVLGYMDDAFSGGVLGASSFSLIVIFIAVHLVSSKVHFSTPGIRAAGAGAACLVKSISVFMLLRLARLDADLVMDVVLQTIITAVFASPVIYALSRLTSLLGPRAYYKDNA